MFFLNKCSVFLFICSLLIFSSPVFAEANVSIANLPATREFGSSSVTLNCSVTNASTLGNISFFISNLTSFNFSTQSWNNPTWNDTPDNITNVTGTNNSSTVTFTLNGNYSDAYKYVVRCEANDSEGNHQSLNYSFIVSMRNFSGFVKNSTDNVTGANVSIYRFIENMTGPPTETLIASNLTGSDGSFTITNVNTTRTCTAPGDTNVTSPMQCQPMFRIKIAYNNSSGVVTQMGPSLPSFPREMIFGPEQAYQCPPGAPADMRCGPPMINGSTLYTQPAATLNITAIGNLTPISVNFGYEIIDQSLGFPIESNFRANVSAVNVTVPIDRNYTVMALRDPQMFPFDESYCTGPGIMNATHCPSPPVSNSSLGTLTQGDIVNIVMNLSYGDYNLTGCINVTGNNSAINITKVVPKLVPWSGFIPPMKAEIQSFNISDTEDLNYSDPRCPGYLAYYRVYVMGSATGIYYFIEFYGKNASDDAGNPGNAISVAAFQNFTIYNNTHPGSFNITLKPLAGAYATGGDVNTSKTTINLFKNTGNKTECNAADTSGTINCTVLSNPHIEVDVKDSNIYNGQNVHYIIEELSNGSFKMPFLNTSTVKISIFEQGSSPLKKTLNLSQNINNITIYSFMPEKILPNGTKVEFNKTDEGMMQNIRFYKSNATCNVYNPPEDCALEGGNFSGATFDPMRAMLAGKSNLRITTPNITLYLINVDLLASGPPEPDRSEAAMSETRSSSGLSAAWRFGSMAPKIYDYVLIGINESSINSSWSYNISIPLLYDENGNVNWNISAGNTSASVPEDYTDYNATNSAYREFLTSAGMSCSFTNSSKECYINATEKKFWLKVPHFSEIQPTISGTAPTVVVTTITSLTTLGETLVGKTGEATLSIPSIAAGKTANVTISKTYDVDFRLINISVVNYVSNIRIIIKKLAGLPADVIQEIIGKVYHYINVTKRNIQDTDMSKVYIKFAVNKSWITANNIDSATIRLYRWSNYQWNPLTTSKVSEDSEEIFYQAESPGLSYFMIGGLEVGALPECTEDWSCTDWSECVEGTQTRICTDLNDCGTTISKPTESQSCGVGVAELPVGWSGWTIATIVSVIIIVVVIVLVYTQKKKIFPKKKPSKKKKVEYYYSESEK